MIPCAAKLKRPGPADPNNPDTFATFYASRIETTPANADQEVRNAQTLLNELLTQRNDIIAQVEAKRAPAPAKPELTLDERIARLEDKIAEAEDAGRPTANMQKRLDVLLIQKEKEGRTQKGEVEQQVEETQQGEELEAFTAEEVDPEGNIIDHRTPNDLGITRSPLFFQRPSDDITEVVSTYGATADKALDEIIARTPSTLMRQLAEVFKGLNLTTTIKWLATPPEGKTDKAGEFDSLGDAITMFGPTAETEHVMHEVAHAATLAQIRKAQVLIAEGRTDEDPRLVDGYHRLDEMRKLAKEKAENTEWYGTWFKDNDPNAVAEFVSEALSNSAFQEYLASIKMPGSRLRNFLTELWNRVKALFTGMDKIEDNSLLHDLLRITPRFYSSDVVSRADNDIVMKAWVGEPRYLNAVNGAFYEDPVVKNITSVRIPSAVANFTDARQQLNHGFAPVARTPASRAIEAMRRFRRNLRDGTREITTVRFDSSLAAGFAHVQNLLNKYNELKSKFRNRADHILGPMFEVARAKGTGAEDQALMHDMIAATTYEKMKKLNEDWAFSRALAGTENYTHVPGTADRFAPAEELVKMGVFTKAEFEEGVVSSGPFGKVTLAGTDEQRARIYAGYKAAMDAMFYGAVERQISAEIHERNAKNLDIASHLPLDKFGEELGGRVTEMLLAISEAVNTRHLDMPVEVTDEISGAKRKRLNKKQHEEVAKALEEHLIPLLRGVKNIAEVKDGEQSALEKLASRLAPRDENGNQKMVDGKPVWATQELKDLAYVDGEPVVTGTRSVSITPEYLNAIHAQIVEKHADAVGLKDAQALVENIGVTAAISDSLVEARYNTIRSIAGGYVHLARWGKFAVRFYYADKDGREIKNMPAGWDALRPFIRDDDATHLNEVATKWNSKDGHGNKPFSVEFEDNVNGEVRKVTKQVRLVADLPREVTDKSAAPGANYEDTIRVIEDMGVKVVPWLRKALIERQTSADSYLRRTLEREGRPGFSMDFTQSIPEHLSTLAAIIATKRFSHDMKEVVSTDQKKHPEWWGTGWEKGGRLAAAKKRYDEAVERNNKNRKATEVHIAEQDLLQTANLYYGQGAAVAKLLQLEANPTNVKLKKEYEELRAKADEFYRLNVQTYHRRTREYVEWALSGGKDSEEITTSFRKFKSGVTVLQLGISVATALNNLSSGLHGFAALFSYNKETGFGGGFKAADVSAAYIAAAKALAPFTADMAGKLVLGNRVDTEKFFMDNITAAAKAEDHMHMGFSGEAWAAMLDLSEKGVLSPQQYNEMMGQASRGLYNDWWGRASSRMMALFSSTEQFNRMAVALAAHSLFEKQAKDAGGFFTNEVNPATGRTDREEYMMRQIEEIVYASQGDYNQGNRPRLFRGEVTSIIFMYKTFAVTTMELLTRMDAQGRALFLGALWFIAGAQGLPGWEELMGVLDALAQRFGIGVGITKGNAEREFKKVLTEWGMDEVVLHGVIDTMTGAHVFGNAGVRLGVPLIGLGRADAKLTEELGKALGPSVGALTGSIDMVKALVKGDPETALRVIPVSGVKHLADAFSYARYDAILNKRGQVVSPEVSGIDIALRVLGYHPQVVNEYNEIVKLENFTRAFAKEMTLEYVEKGRKAMILNDGAALSEVFQEVADHNEIFRGTALEITGFGKKIKKSGGEAKLSLVDRTLKSLPKQQRREYLDELED